LAYTVEQDSYNRKGQAERDRKRKGKAEQDCQPVPVQEVQERTASTGLPAQDCKGQIARAEQKGEDSHNRTARAGRL
jgi:hypothetical protein